ELPEDAASPSTAGARGGDLPEVVRLADPSGASASSGASGLFYGWVMLALATLVMVATSPGQTFGFAFFNVHFRNDLSLSRTELSAAYLVATLLAAAPLSYLGALSDRIGLRRSVLVAVAAMSATCLLAATVQNLAMLFCIFFIMRMVGAGFMTLLANNTLADWFDRRLGLASGAMQLGMAGAVAVVPGGFWLLIEAVGWRQAYVMIAAAIGLTLLPVLLVAYRENPEDVAKSVDGRRTPRPLDRVDQASTAPTDPTGAGPLSHGTSGYANCLSLERAMRTRAYWILIAATGAWALIGTGLVFHMEAIFRVNGLSDAVAARAPMMMAAGMAAMQLFGGVLADRLAIRWLAVAALAGMSLGCSVMAAGGGRALLAGYGVYGLAQGLMTIIAGTAWARYFGRAHLGKIRGTAITAAVGSSSAGPFILGASADYLGGFEPSLWLFAAAAAALSIASWWATPPTDP
ncbi:MAG: MFS transporter, partial [Planctomycetota bacterium]